MLFQHSRHVYDCLGWLGRTLQTCHRRLSVHIDGGRKNSGDAAGHSAVSVPIARRGRHIAAALALSSLAGTAAGGGLMFQRERVDATIRACDTLEIRGIYWFVNEDTAPVSTPIYYPFPIDSFSAYPHSIELARLADKRPMNFSRLPEGIEWDMTLVAGTVDSFQVVYRQVVRRGRGNYIVTTAQAWGRPLQKADFSVTVAPPSVMTFWAFRNDSLTAVGDTLIYHAHYEPFSPVVDMSMRWRCR